MAAGSFTHGQTCFPIINASGSINACLPGSFVTLAVNDPGIATYLWSNGATAASINVTATGTYTVTATYSSGCIEKNDYTVSFAPNYKPDVSGVFHRCVLGTYSYTITNPIAGLTYNWYDAGGNLIAANTTTANITLNSNTNYFDIQYNYGFCNLSKRYYIQYCCDQPNMGVHVNTYNDISLSSLGTAALIPSNDVHVFNGVTIVDVNFDFNNCPNIFFGPAASIVVTANNRLQIKNSTLKGCQTMWKGIKVQADGYLRFVDGAILEDAEIGIDVAPQGELEMAATPPVEIENVMQNNYIDVQLSGQIQVTQGILSTRFDFTGFKPPYAGQTLIPATSPFAAFVINNHYPSYLNLGRLTNSYPLTIRNHASGIIANHANVSIVNTTFQNISQVGAYGSFPATPSGFAIYARASNNRNIIYSGQGNNAADPLSFDNCRGAVSIQSTSATIENAKMNVIRMGVFNRLSQAPSSIKIYNNTIDVIGFRNLAGIASIFSGTSKFDVIANTIHVQASSFLQRSSCIRLDDNPSADNSLMHVTGNVCRILNQTTYGILMQNIARLSLNDNFVFCNQGTFTGSQYHYAFSADNCAEVTFYNNTVNSANSVFQPNGMGFYNYISPRWIYNCNKAYQLHTGFRFDEDCSSPQNFMGNEIEANNYGLYINFPSGAIGIQTHRGNIWSLNNSLFASPHGAAGVYNGANPPQSEFTVHTLTAPANVYNPVLKSTNLINFQSGTPAQCILISPTPPADEIALAEQAVAQADSSTENENGTLGHYVLNRNTYQYIDQNPALLASQPVQQYFDSVALTDLGKLESVNFIYKINVSTLAALTHSRAFNDSVLLNLSLQYQTNLGLLAGNNLTATDSAILVGANATIQAQIIAIGVMNDSISNTAKVYHVTQAHAAAALNQGIVTNGLYTANQKTINALYAQYAAKGNNAYTIADSITILSIAQQCITYGGPAVLAARSLFLLINSNAAFDNTPCNTGSRWSMSDKEPVTEKTSATLFCYPNPATDFITLYLPPTIMQYALALYDMLGNKLKYITGNKHTVLTIPVADLPQGIYQIKLVSLSDGVILHQKIEVVK
ncbi:MAG: T9SS type A sorting domain-containing protein [Bacteroidia bacterium]|nr:T9SS type A sorting domain-containing protein [Bacteroidia bacterium]